MISKKRKKKKTKLRRQNLPHTSSVFKGVRATLEKATKMAMHLMSILPALIQKRQFKQRPYVRALAGQRDEQRHVLRIILHALAVRVKINSPGVSAHHERVGSDVSPNPHPFR